MQNKKDKQLLDKLIEFHGHLGPYLVLGYRMGIIGLRETGAKKYFGIQVSVRCPAKPPERCLVDGLQYATGATYGKANICITKFSNNVEVKVTNLKTKDKTIISFHPNWYQQFRKALVPDEAKMHILSHQIMNECEKVIFCIIKR
jgi:formylmethanofuran dehydrogenase subunit E